MRLAKCLNSWFIERSEESAQEKAGLNKSVWWKVMCLTGVDYFSTLAYQPGIAFLAAGYLSPIATVILVLLTLFGALPIYAHVADKSPNGQGSIAMLEELLRGWTGKAFILCLLGFAATDFMITITLEAADAAAHLVNNPFVPAYLHDRVSVTIVLIALLGLIFLKGFREAIGLSVFLVYTYLFLNLIVLFVCLNHLVLNPISISQWWQNALVQTNYSVSSMVLIAILLFPKLALGLSGFETGVAVMPLIKSDNSSPEIELKSRIENTKLLLKTAAIIMSAFLLVSSFVTTALIPEIEFRAGGQANGRALSYLAHLYIGQEFGTIYDISSIAILWFAGASAMTGLLNLVPRYLPRYGMAPNWTKSTRPLVCFFTAVAFVITYLFKADVDAQGGAYATGVLVLMTSASFAVTLSLWKSGLAKKLIFLAIFIIFTYTTITNMIERPDGLKIASFFILIMLCTSFISRVFRSTELRILAIEFDDIAKQILADSNSDLVCLVAHKPDGTEYHAKEIEMRKIHNIVSELIFLEIKRSDASEFEEDVLLVKGSYKDGFKIFTADSPAVPNAIAALMLNIRDQTGKLPHAYFGWTEGNPISYAMKYIFWGEGETAPLTREILRECEPDPLKRPYIHVA